jgi:HlyD family type I secretion membrane fusion protein
VQAVPDREAAAGGGPHVATRSWPWIAVGLAAIVMAFGGVGGWGATVPLASAVVATGQVTVDTNRKRVQHLEGGIVAELRVRDGDSVERGEILIRLDETRAKASLAIAEVAYREELAKEARFIAERDGKDSIAWPEALQGDADPALVGLRTSQQAIFDSRREALRGEIEILREQIRQLDDEIEGLSAQKAAAERQIQLNEAELAPLRDLLNRGNTTRQRLHQLETEVVRLEGVHGELAANIARAKTAIGETKLEIIQKQKAFLSEVVTGLRDVQSSIQDLRERVVAAQDVLQRIDIRAPTAGMVVGLTVHGANAVVQPGETLLEIVPSGDLLLVEVRVQPQDIDNVAIGQPAEVRILAFKQRTTPTMEGVVSYVSADALTNQQDGSTYYLARIRIPEAQLGRLQGQPLQPGMPAEVMIRTGERTALAYMLQPVLDSMRRAWREE